MRILVAALALVFLAGCSSAPPTAAVNTPAPSASGSDSTSPKPSPAATTPDDPTRQPVTTQPSTTAKPGADATANPKPPEPVKLPKGTEVPSGDGKVITKTDPLRNDPPIMKPAAGVQITADWSPAQVAAVDLAKKADSAFLGLKNVLCEATTELVRPSVSPGLTDRGTTTCTSKIRDSKVFYMDYQVTDAEGPHHNFAISDGKLIVRRGAHVDNSNIAPGDPHFSVASDQQIISRFPRDFTKFVFSPFMKGNATLTRYVAALQKGLGGYSVATQQRQIEYQGRKLIQYRILATRAANPAKKLTNSTVEMIFDGNGISLPMTIKVREGEGKQEFVQNWSAVWKNNQKFTSKDFPPVKNVF